MHMFLTVYNFLIASWKTNINIVLLSVHLEKNEQITIGVTRIFFYGGQLAI